MSKKERNSLVLLLLLGAIVFGLAIAFAWESVSVKTSTNNYCMSCHYHEMADANWKKSHHFINESGTVTDCAACHLPPKEDGVLAYTMAKARMGAKDIFAKMTKDKDEIDWESKRQLDHAVTIVYNRSCEKCHQNLFPEGITDDGITAHLYYEENAKKLNLQCISCHLDAGHYMSGYQHKKLQGKVETAPGVIYETPATVNAFESFTETVPGTGAAIKMVAIPGGSFKIGSPEKEPFRSCDEGPQKEVKISPFFMAETEISYLFHVTWPVSDLSRHKYRGLLAPS